MIRFTESKSVLLAGASIMALSLFSGTAIAQEDTGSPDDTRRLGTVTVTTQKVEQSIQDVPIAVSAFDQEALNKLQLSGGPDLVLAIPNSNFTAGNFGGFNFRIRGIGVDAVAQSSDAGVGVHQNDVPLQANRLLEAEFFDMERIEVLRGPQGTLYGRNATGGVFNAITAKPVFGEFRGNVTGTVGNYDTYKVRGMLNVPLGDMFALRVAGNYLERSGYATNTVTGQPIDGRELYGVRATLAFEPAERFRGFVMVEHFEAEDNRLRAGKQLCAKDPFKTSFAGIPIGPLDQTVTSLGCRDVPLSQMNDRVNSVATLGGGLGLLTGLLSGDAFTAPVDPNLRNIESAFDPSYFADQTLYTWRGQFDLTDSLLLTYTGSYGETSLDSREDYNKVSPTIAFNSTAGPFAAVPALYPLLFPGGNVTDPQLGTTNRFRTFDIAGGSSEQTTHEVRLQSSFDGRVNFNVGAIYVDFESINPRIPTDGYHVLSNSLTALTQLNNAAGGAFFGGIVPVDTGVGGVPVFGGATTGTGGNYFRSLSPYRLESFAVFGESYFDLTDRLKFTLGLRYTDDKKEQDVIPTFLFTPAAAIPGGDPLAPRPIVGATPDAGGDGSINANFKETTGRAGFDWRPDTGFTDDTLLYAFYSRGYKGGGINPPQPAGANFFPQTFDPEFIDSYEIGMKNTLGAGRIQFNATGFFYDYQGYQITQIINRTSANFNINAEIKGLEIETIWNPVSTLVLNANIGLLDTEILDTFSVDTLDRANGRADLVVLKNAANYTNCVVSAQGYATILGAIAGGILAPGDTRGLCTGAFVGAEGAFGLPTGNVVTFTRPDGTPGSVALFTPFDGDAKDLSGNSIPGAPETTLNVGVEYTWEPGAFGDWGLTTRIDYYRQSDSFSRVYNTRRDALPSWDNLNISAALFNDVSGWRIEAFGKNLANDDVITGAYLTDDSSGLFTNIFLKEPRTYGISIGKSW